MFYAHITRNQLVPVRVIVDSGDAYYLSYRQDVTWLNE